jgi:hypothetical protein
MKLSEFAKFIVSKNFQQKNVCQDKIIVGNTLFLSPIFPGDNYYKAKIDDSTKSHLLERNVLEVDSENKADLFLTGQSNDDENIVVIIDKEVFITSYPDYLTELKSEFEKKKESDNINDNQLPF